MEKIEKLLREVRQLQGQVGNLRSKKVIQLAERCGYKAVTRGKEPPYRNTLWPACAILTIPHHSSGLNRYTAKSILQQLEGVLEDHL